MLHEISLFVWMLLLKNEDVDVRIFAKKQIKDLCGIDSKDILDKLESYLPEAPKTKAALDKFCAKIVAEGIPEEVIPDFKKAAVYKKIGVPETELMVLYHDETSHKTALSLAYQMYESHVLSVIRSCYSTYSSEHWEDMRQDGMVGMLKALERFDPKRAKFTTFSKKYIINGITKHCNFIRNSSSTYYNNMDKEIEAAIQRLDQMGFEKSDYNIYILTGISPDIVRQERSYMERTKFKYIDAGEADTEKSSEDMNPDVAAVTNDNNRVLYQAIGRLPNDQATVLKLKYFSGYKPQQISDELGIKPNVVKSLLNKAMTALNGDPMMKRHFRDRLTRAEQDMYQYVCDKPDIVDAAGTRLAELVPMQDIFDVNDMPTAIQDIVTR